ncbi:hypothetical protein LTS18_012289, partial [Coniosporium uncinatum]
MASDQPKPSYAQQLLIDISEDHSSVPPAHQHTNEPVQHEWTPTTNADYNDFWGPDETQGEWKDWYDQKKKAQREKPAVQIRKTYNELAPHATVIEHKPANFTTEAKELIREYLGDLPRRRQVPDEELESLDKI